MSRYLTLLAAVALMVAACSPSASEPTFPTTTPPTTTPPETTITNPPTTTTSAASLAEHRIQVRVVDGQGEFFDAVTGDTFVPRGMNYNRFLPGVTGEVLDSVLSTHVYDPATIDADFAAMKSLGFNVVRVMLEVCGSYRNGCIPGADGRLNPEFMDNLVDFLHRAKDQGLYVMVASNTLPDEGYWIDGTASVIDETFESANNEFLNPKAVPLYVDYWRSVVQALVDRNAPLDVVWAYELRQEHHFFLDAAPLSLESGLVTTANGLTYDMSIPDDKTRMVDEGLVHWTDLIRRNIREIDPTALVTVGFFTPNAPNPVLGESETRLVQTAYFLRNTQADFVDLHHYPGNGVDDAHVWENFGIAGAEEMPIVLGEYGAYRSWWSNHVSAAAAVMKMEVDSCRVGFDGWIEWAWRGDDADDIYWATGGNGEIAEVVAPVNRPDPCEYGDFEYIRYNVAPAATVTASSSDPSYPITAINDGTPSYWNAAGEVPQWVELELENPIDVVAIRLWVAQDPPSRSVHELWVRSSGGEFELGTTFDGTTAEGDILVYEPEGGIENVDAVRVVSTFLEGLAPAWHEIEILTATPPD